MTGAGKDTTIGPSFVLPVRINEELTEGIVDTGAEANLIGEALKPEGLKRSRKLFHGVGGGKIVSDYCGQVVMTCEDGEERVAVGPIVPGTDLILGNPFLLENEAVINFRTGWINLKGKPLPLQTRYCAQVRSLVEHPVAATWAGKLEDSIFSPVSREEISRMLEKHCPVWNGSAQKSQTAEVHHEIILRTDRPIRCHPRGY